MFMLSVVNLYYRNIVSGVEVSLIILLETFALAKLLASLPIGYARFGTATIAWFIFMETMVQKSTCSVNFIYAYCWPNYARHHWQFMFKA